MRSHPILWAPLLFLAHLPAAHADTLQTFTFQGTYADIARSGTASGDLTVDTTLGTVTAATYTISGLGPASITPTQITVTHDPASLTAIDLIAIGNEPTFFYDVYLVLPVDTLVGYGGGPLCTVPTPCSTNSSGVVFFEHGSSFTTGSICC